MYVLFNLLVLLMHAFVQSYLFDYSARVLWDFMALNFLIKSVVLIAGSLFLVGSVEVVF